MSTESCNYKSIFKINGVSILPPLIDDERRNKLNRYKMLAIQVEQSLSERRKLNGTKIAKTAVSEQETESVKLVETSINEQSPPNYDTSIAVDSNILDDSFKPVDYGDSDTNNASATNLALIDHFLPSIEGIAPLSLNIESISSSVDRRSTGIISPSFSLHSSPSLGALNDTKNQSLYFTPLSGGRETLSPYPGEQFQPGKLIRSNSYTIEKPSPMLIKHMEANGVSVTARDALNNKPQEISLSQTKLLPQKKQIKVNHTEKPEVDKKTIKKPSPTTEISVRESKSKLALTKEVAARKSVSPSSGKSPTTSTRLTNRSAIQSNKESKPKNIFSKRKDTHNVIFKNHEAVLRSIYDSGLATRSSRSGRKVNSLLSTTLLNKSNKPISTPSKPLQVSSTSNTNDYKNIFKIIEDQHTAHMNALLQRQKDEQKRMQEEFSRQQDYLVKQISNLILKSHDENSNRNNIANESVLSAVTLDGMENINSISSTNDIRNRTNHDLNANQIHQRTPENVTCMRRLVYYDDHQLVSSDLNKSNQLQCSVTESKVITVDIGQIDATENEVKAATTITAFTRGYLTRRLFKTTKVQNIVKTIRDTLLFILDIHYEMNENESPADVKLKTHLIQQLTSACYSLHNIFFIVPVAQRMEIIAKDREWHQFKLNRSKLSDSFNGKHKHMFSNGETHSARPSSTRMEKLFL